MGNSDKRLAAAATVSGATGLLIGGFLGIAIGASCRDSPRAPAPPRPTPTLGAPLPPATPPLATPVAAAEPVPVPASAPSRDLGTPPYKLHSMTLHRWEGDDWRVRANLMVTRMRAAPEGTQIGTKMTCHVDGVVFVSAGLIGPPDAMVGVGETGATFVDHFFHTPFKGTPQRCELMLYAQMPGARPDEIDHDAGRICVLPDGKTDQVTGEPCPVVVEAPLPE